MSDERGDEHEARGFTFSMQGIGIIGIGGPGDVQKACVRRTYIAPRIMLQ